MSVFCIFGMLESLAMRSADKRTPDKKLVVTDQGKRYEERTPAEWIEARNELAAKILAHAKRRQVSPAFSSPVFALDWMALGFASWELRADAVLMWKRPRRMKDKNGHEMVYADGSPRWIEITGTQKLFWEPMPLDRLPSGRSVPVAGEVLTA